MLKEYIFEVAGRRVYIIAESTGEAEAKLRAKGNTRYYLLTTCPVCGSKSHKLRELIDDYRRVYMEAQLTEEAERVAYLDGLIDGLRLALEVVKGDDKGTD